MEHTNYILKAEVAVLMLRIEIEAQLLIRVQIQNN